MGKTSISLSKEREEEIKDRRARKENNYNPVTVTRICPRVPRFLDYCTSIFLSILFPFRSPERMKEKRAKNKGKGRKRE